MSLVFYHRNSPHKTYSQTDTLRLSCRSTSAISVNMAPGCSSILVQAKQIAGNLW